MRVPRARHRGDGVPFFQHLPFSGTPWMHSSSGAQSADELHLPASTGAPDDVDGGVEDGVADPDGSTDVDVAVPVGAEPEEVVASDGSGVVGVAGSPQPPASAAVVARTVARTVVRTVARRSIIARG